MRNIALMLAALLAGAAHAADEPCTAAGSGCAPAHGASECPAQHGEPGIGWTRWQVEHCTGARSQVVHEEESLAGPVKVYRVGSGIIVDVVGDQVTGVHYMSTRLPPAASAASRPGV